MARGMDPKPLALDYCKPQCIYWKEKLERCAAKLEIVIKTNPTKTCLYPMRDWVTCVEACVSIHHSKHFYSATDDGCCAVTAGVTQGTQRARGHSKLLE